MDFIPDARELLETFRKFRKIFRFEKLFQYLSFSEIMVLRMLAAEDSEQGNLLIQAKDLSERLKMSRPALNSVLNKLEEKNLIERVRNKTDRKAVYIRMTDHACEQYSNEKKRIFEIMNSLVTKFGEENTKKLIALLDQFYNIIENEVQE